jgi:proteasome accessory factor C
MASRKQGAGRKGGLQEARELVAIISSLDHAGDSIDVVTIAGRLGISKEEARHRMELILSASGEGAAVLPLSADAGNGRLTLEGGAGNHARRLRLTKSETIAVQAALDQLGIPVDAPLRKKISSSLSPTGISNTHIACALGDDGGITDSNKSQVGETILTCSKAISQLGMLDFMYQGIADDAPRQRHVDPRGLRNTNGTWYLDAYDPSRHGERVFRLDRMKGVSVTPAEEVDSEPEESVGTRTVRITFHDRHYLELLDWPGLHVERDDGSVVYARIPYYRGDWLPRRLAACSGTVYIGDSEVRSLAVAYARKKLDEQ